MCEPSTLSPANPQAFFYDTSCMQSFISVRTMAICLMTWLLLVVCPARALRRKRDNTTNITNTTAYLIGASHRSVQDSTEPAESEKMERFDQSSDCSGWYSGYRSKLIELPCLTLEKISTLIEDDLNKQSVSAMFDVITFGILTGINELAEVGSFLKDATAPDLSIGASMTVGQLLEQRNEAGRTDAQIELMKECCWCSSGQQLTVEQCIETECYKASLAIYQKVTKQHPAVASTVSLSSKIALGAVVTGITIDAFSAGATGGAGSAIAAQTAMTFSIAKNGLQMGHVVTSCVQQAYLNQCLKDMCLLQN